jgi:hypothetical protein
MSTRKSPFNAKTCFKASRTDFNMGLSEVNATPKFVITTNDEHVKKTSLLFVPKIPDLTERMRCDLEASSDRSFTGNTMSSEQPESEN